MELKKILILLMITSPSFSKTFGSRKNSDDSIADLKWLDDAEEATNNDEEDEKYTVCDTKQCKIIADEFKRAMNKSVDPCEDFHEYVCGNWKVHNPMPAYEVGWGQLFKFQQIVFSRIKGILEVEPTSSDILPVRQAKKWYRSCMDTGSLEKKGLDPLESILVQVGGWPMTMDREEWDEDNHSWQSIEEHYFHITGAYTFYKISPEYGRGNGIELFEGNLPLDDEIEAKHRNYSGNNYDGYVKLIEDITKVFINEHRADVSKKMLEKDVHDMVEFEKQLYLLQKYSYYMEAITIDEFITTYAGNISEIEDENDEIEKISFRRVIRRVFDMVNNDIKDSTPLRLVPSLEYWIGLTKLLNKTPKRTIVNYIHWHFVSTMIKYTTENMRDLLWQYKNKEYGVIARQPRWLECVHEMKMTAAASYIFTQKYFPERTETDVREMIDHIRNEIKSQIEKTDWLDEESKELSVDKLNAMKIFVGFPNWYKNRTSVLNSYNGLTIGSNHFGNVLSYRRYKVKRSLRKMSLDSDLDPTTVNAYYSMDGNSIHLPAADFQTPLFTPKLPRNINYGVTGVVIGHEIGHGFDDHGITLGKDGNETKISEQMMDMYYKRAECFRDQYNEYLGVSPSDYDETTSDYDKISFGLRTRGENIADSTGLQSVFEAYKKMIEKKPKGDYRLPGFEEYSDSQMFFISFGAMLCGEVRPKLAEEMEKFDSHSPMRLRVIGAVSNTNDFAKTFNCPKGSPMNPDNKCSIWKAGKKHNDHEKKPQIVQCYAEPQTVIN
ncbi:hypothetical protein PV328_007280 [Microctonus aethiopoides]|uniref:Uncharacterized protein n=1 Tax=Microctonus aethiopoides TaxID=144406 RepID=A0AA39FRA9_9HYME|nr:hypothetical protein PV328_007280 [Microctonus aethiopoides]